MERGPVGRDEAVGEQPSDDL
ncbi:MAG: hypothetical protein RLZZ362_551, partial [Actinomycetota bacterium]